MIDKMISSGHYPPILLLFGEEELLVEEAAKQLFDAASSTDATGMNCEMVDGDGMSLDAVLSIARSFPMMSERRVLWVKHFDKVQASRPRKGKDLMEAYIDAPTPSTFLLLTADLPKAAGISASMKSSKAAATRKINTLKYPFDVLVSKGAFGEYPRMRESDVVSWLIDRASRNNVTLSSSVAQFLVARTSGSLRELSMELDKLLTYLADKHEITEEDIIEVIGSGRSYNVFELQRAIGNRNLSQAITIVTKMLEAERQELLILTMLTRFFTSLFKLADCAGMTDRGAIAKEAGIPAFAVSDHLSMLDRLGIRTVERALSEIRAAELLLKSTSRDPLMVLEIMLVKVIGSPQGGAL